MVFIACFYIYRERFKSILLNVRTMADMKYLTVGATGVHASILALGAMTFGEEKYVESRRIESGNCDANGESGY